MHITAEDDVDFRRWFSQVNIAIDMAWRRTYGYIPGAYQGSTYPGYSIRIWKTGSFLPRALGARRGSIA